MGGRASPKARIDIARWWVGKIERLWNGETPSVPTISATSLPERLANPDGEELDLAGTLLLASVAALNGF